MTLQFLCPKNSNVNSIEQGVPYYTGLYIAHGRTISLYSVQCAVPYIPAEIKLLLGEIVSAQKIVKLVHRQSNDLIDREGDPCVPSQFLILFPIDLCPFYIRQIRK